MSDTLNSRESSLRSAFLAHLPYAPNEGQTKLIDCLCRYVCSGARNSIYLLKGYAGTGKTSLTAALVDAMADMKMKTVLMAPTGRAAKVFATFAGRKASTIHKVIFRTSALDVAPAEFQLAENTARDTLFIIDEASMIGDSASDRLSLLDSLLHYVYSGYGCRAILIGDTAQLPPVGQDDSPAMQPDRLRRYGLEPQTFELDEPVRQARESGILYNATRLRMMLARNWTKLPRMKVTGYPDVEVVDTAELMDCIETSYSAIGRENTLMITRSNRSANLANLAIRNRVFYAEEELMTDERLVVSKNNYFWSRENKGLSFLANGESIELTWAGEPETRYGRRFADVEFRISGKEDIFSAKIMLDSLMSETPNMSRTDMQTLLARIEADTETYPDDAVKTGASELSRRIRILHTDPYLNALQVKYAYCLTCHKAQGGQWRHVYIDPGWLSPDISVTDLLRWLYTAVTRASDKIFLVNPALPCD